MGWGSSKAGNGGNAGSDGANTPKGPVGNISKREMDELERRAEARDAESTARWTAVHQQAYDKRGQN